MIPVKPDPDDYHRRSRRYHHRSYRAGDPKSTTTKRETMMNHHLPRSPPSLRLEKNPEASFRRHSSITNNTNPNRFFENPIHQLEGPAPHDIFTDDCSKNRPISIVSSYSPPSQRRRFPILEGAAENYDSFYGSTTSKQTSSSTTSLANVSLDLSRATVARKPRRRSPSPKKKKTTKRGMIVGASSMVSEFSPIASRSSLRRKRIYVRIKRPTRTMKSERNRHKSSPRTEASSAEMSHYRKVFSGNEMLSKELSRKATSIGQTEEDDAGTESWHDRVLTEETSSSTPPISKLDDVDHSLAPCSEKILMTRNLLSMECGPLWWDLQKKPPASFVLYLTDIMSSTVQDYLKNRTEEVYWIKHVRFWIQLLNPQSEWWTNEAGSIFNKIARRLFYNLVNRWTSSSDLIEFHDSQDQSIFIRACVLFASERHDDFRADGRIKENQV